MARYWVTHTKIFDSSRVSEHEDYSLMLWVVNVKLFNVEGNILIFIIGWNL